MSKNKIQNICVFCGSSLGNSSIYSEKTVELAQQLIFHKIGLVYGGSSIGLMRIIADEVFKSGLPVIGVIPKFLASKEIAYSEISELILTDNMYERKMKMVELSDAFITMPGGFGTLDELSEILTLYQLNLTDKPLAIYNVNHYYDPIIKQLDIMEQEGFLRYEHRNNIIIERDPQKLVDNLLNFHPKLVPTHWVDHLKATTDSMIKKQ